MAELRFGPQADDFLTELEGVPGEPSAKLLAKLNTALDRLENDPGDVYCRRRRFENIGVWGITVVQKEDEWLILWELGNDDSVTVHAITRAP